MAANGSTVNRDLGLDALRGFAMLLVMYGHVVPLFNNDAAPAGHAMFLIFKSIYGFHVPLFFAISGFFFRPKDWRATLKNGLMLIVISITVHIVACVGSSVVVGKIPYWKAFLKPIVTLEDLYTGVVWFLVVLAFVQVIAHAMLVQSRPRSAVLFLATIGLFFLGQRYSAQLFYSAIWFPALVFFLLGRVFFAIQGIRSKLASPVCLSLLAVISTAAAVGNFGCPGSFVEACPNSPWGFVAYFYAGRIGNTALFAVSSICGSLAAIGLADFLVAKIPSAARALGWVGQRTLHMLIINGFASSYVGPHIAKYFYSGSAPGDALLSLVFVVLQIAAYAALFPVTNAIKKFASFIGDKCIYGGWLPAGK